MTHILSGNSITTPEERRRGFMVLFLSLICIGMGKTLMFSILPALGRKMGLSEIQVVAIFATNAGAWVIFSPIWGRKSDFWGRRPVILIGLFGYAVSLVALALVTQMGLSKVWPLYFVYPLMVLSRLIFGVIGSGSVPASQAYVTDRTSRQERSAGLARLAAAFGFGAMVGPGVGGLFADHFGYLAPIYFVAMLAFLSGVLIWFYLPERTGPKPSEKEYVKLSFRAPEILPFALGSAVLGIAMAVSQQFIVYYSMDYFSMTEEEALKYGSFALMASAFTALFVQMAVIPRLSYSPGLIFKAGLVILIFAFTAIALAQNTYVLLIAMGVYGAGFGLCMPSNLSAASLSAGKDKQGATAGIIAAFHSIGNVIGSLAGALLYKVSISAPFILAFVLASIFLIYAIMNPRINVAVQEHTLPAKSPGL